MGNGRARDCTLADMAREAARQGVSAADVLASLQALDVIEQASLGGPAESVVHQRARI